MPCLSFRLSLHRFFDQPSRGARISFESPPSWVQLVHIAHSAVFAQVIFLSGSNRFPSFRPLQAMRPVRPTHAVAVPGEPRVRAIVASGRARSDHAPPKRRWLSKHARHSSRLAKVSRSGRGDQWPLPQRGSSQIPCGRIHFYKIGASCVLRIWPRVVEVIPGGDKCLFSKRRAAMTPSALNLNGESIGQVDIRPPLSVAPGASVREVLRLLKEHRRGSVLVCRQGRLVGILTERDILRLLAGGHDLDVAVEREMVPDPLTVGPSDTVGAAVERMAENGYRRLPLVDSDNRPIGEVDVEGIVHLLVQHFPQAVYNLPPLASPPTREREGP